MQAPQNPIIARLVIGPNASLTPKQAAVFMGGMCMVGFGIAGVFALQGFWPVLPFAGLELAALGAALWISLQRNRYREVISFTDTAVRIEFGLVGRGAEAVVELPRAWTRVNLATGPYRNSPTRVVFEYCGQRVVIGRCLTDEEHESLAARIRQLLRGAGQPAPPADAPAQLTLGG